MGKVLFCSQSVAKMQNDPRNKKRVAGRKGLTTLFLFDR